MNAQIQAINTTWMYVNLKAFYLLDENGNFILDENGNKIFARG